MMIKQSLAVLVLYVAMLGAAAAGAGAAGGSVIGPAHMEGIRTTRDGRGLVLVFIGGRPYRATDPCSVRYSSTVCETEREVDVVVSGQRPPDSQAGVVCTTEEYSRTLTVPLHTPLRHRQLTGSATPEHGVFDGELLARPAWLPTGWRATGGSGAGAEGSWTQPGSRNTAAG